MLGEAKLVSADLYGALLNRADLTNANLFHASLKKAELYGATLRDAVLAKADLAGANLCEADLSGANLTGANLRGANLSRANLSAARLTSRGYGDLSFDESTVWPTAPELLVGTTIDGVSFVEWVETLNAIGPDPSDAVLVAWDAMNAAKLSRTASVAASLNDGSRSAGR
jgi:uncharacterized protein YjbI with pentapeptide repeats